MADERARTAEVADDRNHEVALLQRLDELKRFLRGEVVAALAERIGREQQLTIGRVMALRRAAGRLETQPDARLDESAVEPIDRREVLARERHAGPGDRLVHARAESRDRARVERRRLRRAPRRDREARRATSRRRPVPAGRASSARYSTRVRASVKSDLKRRWSSRLSRLTSTMNDDVGPDGGDVGEVLIRPDADVGAAADAALLQIGNDIQIRTFVRDQVVGVEVSRRLGERRDLGREG